MNQKRNLFKTLGVLIALLATLLGGAVPANATGDTLSVSGFATMKYSLTSAQKSAIRTYVTANPGASTVSCVGYAGYNYLGEARHKIVALATTRAQKACDYAAARAGATVGTVSYVLSNSRKASIRKVVITFGSSRGRYQYSMSNLDAGSVLHGGPVTGYFYEGDLVASTFADTAWSLDASTPPEYGNMGTVNGGDAAAFNHWCTSADDTGTKYYLGDHLGPAPAGTTITLYAIASTG
ncbi:MAG: hypothetical protein RL140_44 [Actinomycetota bacterium]